VAETWQDDGVPVVELEVVETLPVVETDDAVDDELVLAEEDEVDDGQAAQKEEKRETVALVACA